jgi:DNA-binding FadR family transcriptional regulator
MKNMHGHTLDLLGEAIVAGRYAAGDSIPSEPVLGDQLGVSRTVLREAVKSLAAKGVVSPGRGWARACPVACNASGSTPQSSPGRVGSG